MGPSEMQLFNRACASPGILFGDGIVTIFICFGGCAGLFISSAKKKKEFRLLGLQYLFYLNVLKRYGILFQFQNQQYKN